MNEHHHSFMFHPCHVRSPHPQLRGCLLGLVDIRHVQHGWMMGWRSAGGVMRITKERHQQSPHSAPLVGVNHSLAALRLARVSLCVLEATHTTKSAVRLRRPPSHPCRLDVRAIAYELNRCAHFWVVEWCWRHRVLGMFMHPLCVRSIASTK